MTAIDLGKIALIFKDTYNGATAYEANDIVTYTDGGVVSTFIAKVATTGNAPSTGGTVHASWALMAKGTDSVGMSWNANQTASFTASSENGYYVDTSGGQITMTLPAAASLGDRISIQDTEKSFQTNPLTLAANGLKIEGNSDDYALTGQGVKCTLTYEGTSKGWTISDYNADQNRFGRPMIDSSVGSKKWMIATSDAEEVYQDGDYTVHKFRSSGTFTVHTTGTDSTFGDKIEYLLVGGGGGGGTHHGTGGGGSGGYRGNAAYDYTVTAQAYAIVVGEGAAKKDNGNNHGHKGSDSTFDGMNSEGGGGGGCNGGRGQNGGSGGGAGHSHTHGSATGNGTGHRGGDHGSTTGGGGGGAGERGGNHDGAHMAGMGGRGLLNDISGIPEWYAAGGGGSGYNHTSCSAGGSWNAGGGNGGDAQDGYGGGGGGNDGPNGGHNYGGRGGSGICIIRYKSSGA